MHDHRTTTRNDRLDLLHAALAGLDLTDDDRQLIDWLAGCPDPRRTPPY